MHVATLAHRAESGGNGLRRFVPVQPSIHRYVAMLLVLVAVWALGVWKIPHVLVEEVCDALGVDLRRFARRVESGLGRNAFKIANCPPDPAMRVVGERSH